MGQKEGHTATQRGHGHGDEPQQPFDRPEEHLEETEEQPNGPEQQRAQQPQRFGWKKDVGVLKVHETDGECHYFPYVSESCGCFSVFGSMCAHIVLCIVLLLLAHCCHFNKKGTKTLSISCGKIRLFLPDFY